MSPKSETAPEVLIRKDFRHQEFFRFAAILSAFLRIGRGVGRLFAHFGPVDASTPPCAHIGSEGIAPRTTVPSGPVDRPPEKSDEGTKAGI